ncbi:MAG: hypothetical protein PVJ38_05225 [Candidatus Bathyarchaeota archaeon]|jgi:predicted nucleotidyltransferase
MDLRVQVAKEAARLIYTGASEEYKQAKERAAHSLGIDVLPSNHEVAVELDILADSIEGEARRKLLVKMRELALKVMMILQEMSPILRGSVWRGTSRQGSDVDIDVYSNNPNEVEVLLAEAGYKVKGLEEAVTVHGGRTSRSTHIETGLGDGIIGEVVVRPVEERDLVEKCDIYGDPKKGLDLLGLVKLMKTDPLRKFVPGRRYR